MRVGRGRTIPPFYFSTMTTASVVSKLRSNWKSGITVALVSIPLSVSLAVASNSTPTAGIITAIWAGIIAAFFGGSLFNIVGPTGALSGILASYALLHGSGALPMLAIAGGVLMLLAYAFRLERFLVFVPANTIHGFTLGVAFIIALNQLPFALGLSGLEKHERFISNVFESLSHLGSASGAAGALFAVSLALIFALLRFVPKVPGAIVLAVLGIGFGYASSAGMVPFAVETLGQKFPDIAPKLFEVPQLVVSGDLLIPAVAVALVAILETMISAKIADVMTKTKHDKRREMLGLGLANVASGLVGGIPATAALARTSLNIKSGADDRMSAIVSSVCIALISLLLLTSFRYIPLAVVAAILVFVAFRMVEREHFLRMFHFDRPGFFLAVLVAAVTIGEDPIFGILFGTAVSLVMFVEKASRGQFELIVNDKDHNIVDKISADKLDQLPKGGDTLVYSVKGQLAYVNGASHTARFEAGLNGYRNVILRLRELSFVDLDGVDSFNEIVASIESQGKRVLVSGVNPLIWEMMKESEAYRRLESDGRVFRRTSEALASLGY